MNGSLKVVQGLVLLALLSLVFSSCGGSQSTLSSTTTSGTTTTNPGPTSSGTLETEEEEKNATIPSGYSASDIFVTIPDTIDYLNYSSLYGNWTSRCTFTSASVVNDLTCNFEANELALYFDGVKFQYNVPANSCKYIGTYPYWYWNFEVGTGPTDVTVTVTKNASGVVTAQQCTVDGSAAFACNNLAAYPTAGADIQVDVADEIDVKCNYDTSDEDGGANCCFGKYRLRTTVNTPDSSTTTDERGKEWGGNVAACIGGAGKTDWKNYSAQGYPNYLIEKMTPNVARTKIYKVSPPIQKVSNKTNIPIANFFTTGKHTHTGFGTQSGTATSIYPYYIKPLSDRSGDLIDDSENTALPAGSPFYYFDCLDEAFEVNYRIRVLVQEWDTVAALTSYISTGVSSPVGADEPGTAPTKCPGISGEACNQAKDADNFVDDQTSGNYSNASASNRKNYFPQHTYK